MIKNIFHTLVILFVTFQSCIGQYNLINYSVDDGLPSQETYFVHEDHDGFIWICTDRGVSRYNGYEFENFSTNDGLTYNTVFKIFEDKNRDLWMICFDGSISIFSYKLKRFIPFWGNKELLDLKANSQWIASIGFKDESIYFPITRKGGGGIDPIIILAKQEDSSFSEIDFNFKQDTVLAFENMEMIFYFFDYYQYKNMAIKEVYGKSSALTIPNHLLTKKFEIIRFDDSVIYTFSKENVVIYEVDTTIINVPGRITGLLRDSEKNIWITTLYNGVYKISTLDIKHLDLKKDLLEDEKLMSVSSLNENLLIGTNKRKYFGLNSNENVPKLVHRSAHFVQSNNQRLNEKILSYGMAFTEINGGWRVKSINPWINTFPHYRIKVNENLYAGYVQSANIYFYNNGNFSHVIDSIKNKTTIVASGAFKNTFYFSTFDSTFAVYANYKKQDISKIYGLESVTVRCIESISDSVLLFGTSGKGLVLVKNSKVYTINERMGLLSDMVNDIEIDDNNNIWCATNRGLTKIYLQSVFDSDTAYVLVENYTYKTGLKTNNISKLHYSGNEIFGLSNKGLDIIKTNRFSKIEQKIKLHITGIFLNDSSYKNKVIWDYNQNSPKITFIGLSSFKPSAKPFYSYSIKHGDDIEKWVKTNNRSITFNDLDKGEYTFKVKAQTENGTWSDTESIQFTIKSHWTGISWVQTLFWFIISLLVFLFVSARLVKRQKSLEKEVEYGQIDNKLKTLELDVLRGQMNPHLIYNALNSAQSLMIKGDKKKATEFINKLSKLLRSSLEFSRKEHISIEDEINFLTNYFNIENQRFLDRFRYTINCEDELLEDLIPPLILQPLCENAVKHSYNGTQVNISIQFTPINNHYYSVVISDNGKGFDNNNSQPRVVENSEKSSLGLVILKRRIAILKEDFPESSYEVEYLDENKKQGTKITLVLPQID